MACSWPSTRSAIRLPSSGRTASAPIAAWVARDARARARVPRSWTSPATWSSRSSGTLRSRIAAHCRPWARQVHRLTVVLETGRVEELEQPVDPGDAAGRTGGEVGLCHDAIVGHDGRRRTSRVAEGSRDGHLVGRPVRERRFTSALRRCGHHDPDLERRPSLPPGLRAGRDPHGGWPSIPPRRRLRAPSGQRRRAGRRVVGGLHDPAAARSRAPTPSPSPSAVRRRRRAHLDPLVAQVARAGARSRRRGCTAPSPRRRPSRAAGAPRGASAPSASPSARSTGSRSRSARGSTDWRQRT